jgi:hypothetical protein
MTLWNYQIPDAWKIINRAKLVDRSLREVSRWGEIKL